MLRIPVSFEFFPPKTPAGMTHLTDTAYQLAHCHPTFFSVTFGAGGSTRDGTMEAIKLLQRETHTPVAAHLSCIGSKREDILNILRTYQALGIKRLIALRGDLPTETGYISELQFANELVAFIRETTGHYFHIEVAAYPECHPQSQTSHDDIIYLKKKYEAGANSAITQYFFNADAYFYFLDDCSKHGVNMPIIPGIMPITQLHQLIRFSAMCGAEIPRWIIKRLESYADDAQSLQTFGLEVVHHLCEQLIAGGAPGLHFYTLNRPEASLALWQLLIGKSQSTVHLMLNQPALASN